jgi:hypothetical protein
MVSLFVGLYLDFSLIVNISVVLMTCTLPIIGWLMWVSRDKTKKKSDYIEMIIGLAIGLSIVFSGMFIAISINHFILRTITQIFFCVVGIGFETLFFRIRRKNKVIIPIKNNEEK